MSSGRTFIIDSEIAIQVMQFMRSLNASVGSLKKELREVKKICRKNAKKLQEVQNNVRRASNDRDSGYGFSDHAASRESSAEPHQAESSSSSSLGSVSSDAVHPASASEVEVTHNIVNNDMALVVVPKVSVNGDQTPSSSAPTEMRETAEASSAAMAQPVFTRRQPGTVAELEETLRAFSIGDVRRTKATDESIVLLSVALQFLTIHGDVEDVTAVQEVKMTDTPVDEASESSTVTDSAMTEQEDSVLVNAIQSESVTVSVVVEMNDVVEDRAEEEQVVDVVMDTSADTAVDNGAQPEAAVADVAIKPDVAMEEAVAVSDTATSSSTVDGPAMDVDKGNASKDIARPEPASILVAVKVDADLDEFLVIDAKKRQTSVQSIYTALKQLDDFWTTTTGRESLLGDPVRIAQEIEHSIAVRVDQPPPDPTGMFADIKYKYPPDEERYTTWVQDFLATAPASDMEALKRVTQQWCNRNDVMFEGAGPTMHMVRARSTAECKRADCTREDVIFQDAVPTMHNVR